jgi:hypothetical protein
MEAIIFEQCLIIFRSTRGVGGIGAGLSCSSSASSTASPVGGLFGGIGGLKFGGGGLHSNGSPQVNQNIILGLFDFDIYLI